ncbi:MAG: anthranilate synthase component I family protein [Bacteroidia bacterium]|nr:anthranilate synthase component I family protein [Bacteroidia bacterium]MDW8346940.1 chorismate-binding protein [Bacteroidia bacterium]
MRAEELKTQCLHAVHQSDIGIYLDSHQDTQDIYALYECIAGVGAQDTCEIYDQWTPAFEFAQKHANKWIFFAFSYEAYHQPLFLPYRPYTKPTAVLWTPQYWLTLSKQGKVESNNLSYFSQSLDTHVPTQLKIDLQPLWTKEEYLTRFNAVIEHIKQGDVYELNLCQAFKAVVFNLDTLTLYKILQEQGTMPYSAYWRYPPYTVISTSPERLLALRGSILIAQPMKGTQRKKHSQDTQSRDILRHSLKDRAENVMIVDLMRNDIAKSCLTGSIEVENLFQVLDYGNLYQMISTVKGRIRSGVHFLEAFYHVFPPGSMTGAPKKRSVEIIQQLECIPRGWFSGSIGYISPKQEADSNVLIRTLCYNQDLNELLLHTGGAVVYRSQAEQEYEETLLKAERIRTKLNQTI